MTISILKAVLIIVILGVMVLILLGINHLFSGSFDTREQDAEELRNDVRESPEVISRQSVFHGFVENGSRSTSPKSHSSN